MKVIIIIIIIIRPIIIIIIIIIAIIIGIIYQSMKQKLWSEMDGGVAEKKG